MKKIQSFKLLTLALYTGILCLLSQPSYAAGYNSAVNPHFCLTDSAGQIQQSCSGPALTQNNINIFMPFFNNNPSVTTPINSSHPFNMVPLMNAGSGRMIDNMIPLVINNDPSLDLSNFNPVLTNWQYVNKVIFFGSSESESQVVLPTPGWIRAAHQNNSAILGTLFLSPEEITTSNTDLLIQVAKTYGIDGYFINLINPKKLPKEELQNFIITIQARSQAENYPLQIDTSNHQLISSTSSGLNQNEQQIPFSQIISPGSTAQTLKNSFEQQTQSESDFWQSRINPSLENSLPQDFKILAPNTPAPSINPDMTYSLPFNTYFNTGMGYDYYINGQITGLGIWSDIGLQDLLPNQYNSNVSYQYSHTPTGLNFQQDPFPLTTNPYYGGSVLHVDLSPTNPSALLYTNLGLNLKSVDNPTLVIAYQYPNQDPNQDPDDNVQAPTAQLWIRFKDKSQTHFDLDHGILSDSDYQKTYWHQRTLALSLNNTIDQIELRGGKHTKLFSINLGQIYIGGAQALTTTPSAPINIKLTNQPDDRNPQYTHHVIQWQALPNNSNSSPYQYQIFNTANSDMPVLIGVTGNSAMDFIDQNKNFSLKNICVRTVNMAQGLVSSCGETSMEKPTQDN